MDRDLLRVCVAAALAGAGARLVGAGLTARQVAALRGKVVLITGGSRGLGFALARAFGRIGCRIVICARDAETLARASVALADEGLDVRAVTCDVTDQDEVSLMLRQVNAQLGGVDILIANAVSSVTVGPVVAQTAEDLEDVHATLYWGVVYPTLAVLPQMRERGAGRIVVLSSIGGKLPVPHMAGYSAAKHAATGFAATLRAELAGSGVSVTTIAPGTLRTGAHLHQRYAGRALEEFTWFAKGELAPLMAVPAERAARRIVAATAGRRGEVVFPASARFMARLYGLAPNLTVRLLGLVNRWALPQPTRGTPQRGYGLALQRDVRDPLLRRLTRSYQGVLRRLNQYPDAPPGQG